MFLSKLRWLFNSNEKSWCFRDELLQQQRIAKEEKKRLRRALKELEMQYEARAGRRMQRKDRGPDVTMIYDSYKQTKAKLRLISALLAKSAWQSI